MIIVLSGTPFGGVAIQIVAPHFAAIYERIAELTV